MSSLSSSSLSSSLGSRYGRSARSNKQRRDQDSNQRREQQQRQQAAHPQRRQQQRWHMYPPEQSAHSQLPGPEYALSFAIPKSQVTKETTGETHTLNFGNDWYNENDERQHQAKMDIETSLTMENTVFRRPSWERNDDDSRASFNSRSIDGGNNNNNSAAAFTRSSMAASTTMEFETLTLPNEYDDDDDQSRFSSVAGHSSMGHSSLVFAPSVTSAAPTVKQSNRSFQRPMFLKKRAVTTATTTPPRRGQRPPLRPTPLPFVPPAPLSIAARMESTVVATMEASPVAAATTTATSGTAPPPFTTRPVLAISALGSRPTLPIPRNPPFQRASVSSSLVVTAPSTTTTTTTTTAPPPPLARSTADQSRRAGPNAGPDAGPEHAMDMGDIPMKASFRSLSSAAQSHQAPPPPPSLSHHSTHSTIMTAVSRTKPAPTTASMNLDLPNPYLDEDDAYSRRHSNPYDMEVASHGAKSGPARAGLQCSSRRVRLVLLGGVIVLVGVVLAVVLVLPRTKSQSLVTNNAPLPPTTVPINVSSHNSTHNNHTHKAPVNTAAVAPSRMSPPLATATTISPTVAPPQTVPPTVMLTFAPTPLIAGTATATTSTARTTGNVHDRT
jgi:hypothetical protein